MRLPQRKRIGHTESGRFTKKREQKVVKKTKTSDEFHRLSEVEEVNIKVEAHDGSKSICEKRGTLSFRYNAREIKLEDIPYDPRYSNLISSQGITENDCL
jgi:hypothetical protein